MYRLSLVLMTMLLLAACSKGSTFISADGSALGDGRVYWDWPPTPDRGPDLPLADQGADAAADLAPDQLQPDAMQPDTLSPDTGTAWPDRCKHAQLLKLVGGKVTVNGSTSPYSDEFSTLKCGGLVSFSGPQAYYSVYLDGSQVYTFKLSPGFNAYYYIVSPAAFCQQAAMEKDCSSAGSTGDVSPVVKAGASQSLSFQVPKSGYYTVGVDSASASDKGNFTLSIELDCAAFSNKCNTGVNVSGVCKAQPKTGTCNDEDPCTVNDICVTSAGIGVCKGSPKVCPGNACNNGKCDASSGLCVTVPKTGTCDDGDKCTSGDTCQNGVCKGTNVDCSSKTDICNTGICNKADGKCIAVPKSGTIYCSDGDKCTETDICVGGVCKGTSKKCPSDSCNSGVCDKATGYCGKVFSAGSCSDGNNCTVNDACVKLGNGTGICQGAAKGCGGDQCNTGYCDPVTGACKKAYKAGSCSDGNNCTVSDTCYKKTDGSGACAGTTLYCAGDSCNNGYCDKATGTCQKAYKAGFCSDGNNCTVSDTCYKLGNGTGACAGIKKVCTSDQCNSGYCDPTSGACKKAFKPGGCSDGNNCTITDTCYKKTDGSGACAGATKYCAGDQCNNGYCDKASGACKKSYKGGACSDGNSCTAGDTCYSSGGIGYCKSGAWPKDGYESNNTCGAATNMGSVNEDSWLTKTASISPPGDVDWFRFKGLEAVHACWPGSSQTYYLRVQVVVPAGRTYRVCVHRDSCSGASSCATGTGTVTVQRSLSGTCIVTDDRWGYVRVYATDGKQQCQGYSVSFNYH